jgi:hypothetical protein
MLKPALNSTLKLRCCNAGSIALAVMRQCNIDSCTSATTIYYKSEFFVLKKFTLTLGVLIALHANFAEAASPERDYQAEAAQVDASYWAAYNRVDPAGMNSFVSDDVEFYHDRGGSLIGKAALSAVNDGMKTMKNHLRRVAVPGTVRIFLMRKGEDVYGAVVTGEHQFYVIPEGKPEFLAGTSYFTQLMTVKGKEWKISRIFSYEHVNAAPSSNK